MFHNTIRVPDVCMFCSAQTLDFIHWKNDIGLIFITGFFGDNVQPLHTSVVPIDRAMQVELQGFGTIFPGYRDNRTKLIGRKLFARSYRDCVRESGKLYNYAVKLDPHQACTVDPNHETKKCVMNVGGPVTICELYSLQHIFCDKYHQFFTLIEFSPWLILCVL